MVNLDVITQANTIDVNMIINACFGGVGVDVVGDIGAGYGVAELNELSPACGAWWDGGWRRGSAVGLPWGGGDSTYVVHTHLVSPVMCMISAVKGRQGRGY